MKLTIDLLPETLALLAIKSTELNLSVNELIDRAILALYGVTPEAFTAAETHRDVVTGNHPMEGAGAGKRRVNVLFSERLYAWLKQRAKKRETSMSKVLRDDLYLMEDLESYYLKRQQLVILDANNQVVGTIPTFEALIRHAEQSLG